MVFGLTQKVSHQEFQVEMRGEEELGDVQKGGWARRVTVACSVVVKSFGAHT